jgi:hypothetical protein
MKQVGTTHWVGNNVLLTVVVYSSSGVSLRQWYLRRERAAGRWWSSTQDSGTSAGSCL